MKLPADELESIDDIKVEYEKFFEVSLDMFCISSYDGYFKKVNTAFAQTLGYTEEVLCTKSYLEFIHPDDIARTTKEVEKQLLTKAHVLCFENRYRHSDGTYRWLSWKSAPVGKFMYAAARDVTDNKIAIEELLKTKTSLEMVNSELEAFSYSVAHDLRAPIRSILGFSTLIAEDSASTLSPATVNHLHRVMNATKKMGVLIDGLLNLSRITRKEFQKTSVNLSLAAQEVAEELKLIQPGRLANFIIEQDIRVEGDSALLKTVISNLVENAWKYTSKLKIPARIEFGRKSENGHAVYFVKDNGAGFDMKFANKLFGVFQRLHAPNEFEGTGIGLATVHRIVSRHGGRVWATGTIDGGATFYFTI